LAAVWRKAAATSCIHGRFYSRSSLDRCSGRAGALRRFLGVNGVNSLSRIMGFLLICIGVQFAINGVRDLVLDVDFWK
jgi:hypothetical protein